MVHRNRLWLYSGDDPPTWFETPLEQESLVDSDGPESDPVCAGELPVIDSSGITDIPAVEPVETEDERKSPGRQMRKIHPLRSPQVSTPGRSGNPRCHGHQVAESC